MLFTVGTRKSRKGSNDIRRFPTLVSYEGGEVCVGMILFKAAVKDAKNIAPNLAYLLKIRNFQKTGFKTAFSLPTQ